MPSITFTAATLDELRKQINEFLGVAPVPAVNPVLPMPQPSKLTVPDWAPPGARWVPMPGAPVLVDAAGNSIPVDWAGVTPKPGKVIVNHDPVAEALGEALLNSTRAD